MYIQAPEIKHEFHTHSDGKELLKLLEDLQWDYDRFSTSGQQTYDQIGKLLGWEDK